MKNIFYHRRKIKLLGLFLALFVVACSKEEAALTPTQTPEKTFTIPQGNHSYDTRIVNYFNRFGSYILYKYTDQDIKWNVTFNDSFYKTVQADTNYVDKQLDLLDQTFFKYYQDSTLRNYLPVKFFLCSSLRSSTYTQEINTYMVSSPSTETATVSLISQGGYQSFAVNWGRSDILNIKTKNNIDSTIIFKNDVNFSFLKMAIVNSKMTVSADFLNTSDYTSSLSVLAPARYARGFLANTSGMPDKNVDWYSYLRAITSTSYTDLTNATTPANDISYKGILNSLKDPNGLIKKKYNFIINHYRNKYNIDLQAIGNNQ